MAISQVTNAFMRALPSGLRPNPYNIEEHVMEAVGNGWETDSLAKACYINEKNPNPAFVVVNLRNLAKHPPQVTTQRTGWSYGHMKCEDRWHEHNCEICRCVPGEPVHMVPVTSKMPATPFRRTP